MADQFQFDAIFNFAIKGAQNARADARGLTGALDEMYKTGQLTDKQYERLSKSAIAAGKASETAAAGTAAATRSTASLQYGINQAATTLAVGGAALVAFGGAAFAAGIKFEASFAQVARTSALVGQDLDNLKADLTGLAQELTTSFADITSIASLGAQLGIAGKDIASFTETVSRLVTASDLTVDAAATGIARVGQLTGVAAEDFEKLGSSIALVGVESIATESQIVKTANNIASIGAFAGFSAADVIGLSGALASLGVPPELSRGTLQRFFTQAGKAVDAGGDSLNNFARISGRTSEEFAASFRQGAPAGDSVKTFVGFLKGLGSEGDNARNSLRDLGITSVRDVPTLLKLAQSAEVVEKAFADANQGFAEGTELQRQYNIIAGTTSAKIERLKNNFEIFLATIGSNGNGVIGSAVDGLNSLLGVLTDLANFKPFESSGIGISAGDVLAVGAAITVLLGILALATAGVGRLATGFLALREVMALIPGGSIRAALGLTTVGAAAEGAAHKMTFMQATATKLKGAIGLLGAAALAVTLASLFEDGLKAASGFDSSAEAANKRLLQVGDTINGNVVPAFDSLGASLNTAFPQLDRLIADTFGKGLSQATNDIKAVDEQLATLVQNGNISEATEQFQKYIDYTEQTGGSVEKLASLFPSYTKAAQDATGATEDNADKALKAKASQEALEAQIQESEESFKSVYEALKNYNNELQSNANAQAGFYEAVDSGSQAVYDAGVKVLEASGQYKDLEGNVIATEAAIRAAGKASLDASGNFDITTESGRAADAQLRGLADAGNKAAAELFNTGETADTVSAKLDENEAAVRKLGEEYGLSGAALDNFVNKYVASPKDFNYNLNINNLGNSQAAIDGFIARNSGKSIPMYIQVSSGNVARVAQGRGGSGGLTYAEGGYTGRGGKYDPAGIVHRGEYVVPKKFVNQSTGLPYADALNRLSRGTPAPTGYANGGFASGGLDGAVVELGPKSLARVGQQAVNFILDSNILASSVNRTNANNAYRGGGR